jgi:hypothetical protein
VTQSLQASVVRADVMPCPANTELLALGRQLTDEVRQVLVVRRATRFGPQDGDGGVGGRLPVDVERSRARVQGSRTVPSWQGAAD